MWTVTRNDKALVILAEDMHWKAVSQPTIACSYLFWYHGPIYHDIGDRWDLPRNITNKVYIYGNNSHIIEYGWILPIDIGLNLGHTYFQREVKHFSD